MKPRAVLKWPGSKWNLVEWLGAHLPPHDCYLETHFGSGALFFSKTPSRRETINDLSGDVVRLFRVLRDRPEDLARAMALTPYAREEWDLCRRDPEAGDEVERVRRFLVRQWQSVGYSSGGWRTTKKANAGAASVWNGLPERIADAALRLKEAHIECRPAVDCLRRYADTGVLVYCDPPYPQETRQAGLYPLEMSADDHAELLGALEAHPGPVLLSGYDNALYRARLPHWSRRTCEARALTAEPREEVLWMNPECLRRLSAGTLGLLEEG